jgi:pSer/pThr/pTyr-binding forkhead associated (FHA) protein
MSRLVRCGRCGQENEADRPLCGGCGQVLRAEPLPPGADHYCSGCGARLQPAFRFCAGCGTPVAAQPPHGALQPAPPPPAGRPAPSDDEFVDDPGRRKTLLQQGAPAAQAPRLSAIRHDGLPGAVYALEREETTCGRTEGEIRLADDPAVSPRHARFVRRAGTVEVEDLGSANGTYLRLRAPHPLGIGEEIRMGRQLLRLEPLARPVVGAEPSVRPWGSPDAGARHRLTQLLDGGGTGEVFPLAPGDSALGREAGQVVFPGDRYVSARHARLSVGAGGVTLTDLGSSNGTFVRVLGLTALQAGDQLLIGSQLLRLDL